MTTWCTTCDPYGNGNACDYIGLCARCRRVADGFGYEIGADDTCEHVHA